MLYHDMNSRNPEKKWRQKRLSRSKNSPIIYGAEIVKSCENIDFLKESLRNLVSAQKRFEK